MDLATVLGVVGAIGLLVMAMMLSGDIGMFIDTQSMIIVFGGSLFIVLANYNLAQFFGIGKIIGKAFMFKIEQPDELIEKSVEMADAACKGGFLALEEAEISNGFMQKGVDMLVDGHDADVVRGTLQKDINLTTERHETGVRMMMAFADVAPAMGMIGTLIGLVAMLSNMDDPKAIGPAMAVALLTTLYGAMLANMICIPFADKLTLRMEEENLIKSMAIDAVLAIQAGQNPRVIEGMLRTYLSEGKRPVAEE